MEYSELSNKLRKKINKEDKKKEGIFFTPPITIINTLKLLEPYFKNIKTVLEPSCGSCEYIYALNRRFNKLDITGVEHNNIIFESIKDLDFDNVNLINNDYLKLFPSLKYIILVLLLLVKKIFCLIMEQKPLF